MQDEPGKTSVSPVRRWRCRRAYGRLGAPLLRYLCALTGDRAVAEDVLHDTFLKMLTAESPGPPEEMRRWLFRVARNLAIDRMRRTGRQRGIEGVDFSGDATDPSAEAQANEEAARVRAALAGLPEAQREVLVLRHAGDLKFREIAEITGAPIGTVLGRARNALRRLAAQLDSEVGTEAGS